MRRGDIFIRFLIAIIFVKEVYVEGRKGLRRCLVRGRRAWFHGFYQWGDRDEYECQGVVEFEDGGVDYYPVRAIRFEVEE